MYKQTNINIMHSRIVNKTRYDDSWKPIKQTSFIVKNLGKNLPKKQFTIIKRSFRSSTKLLSLNSTILIDKLIVETFYRFKISELFNIWMLHPQSQLEPPTDFKNLLKVFLIMASLWWLLWLQLLHQWNLQIYFETFWFGEIEKTWLQNPSHINEVFLSLSLSLKILLIDGLWCPLNISSNGSQFEFQMNKLWAFSHCWFLLIREAWSIELLSRTKSR